MRHTTPHQDNDRCLNRQGGFTLLEIVIALTVFSIGLLAASMMQSSSIKGNKASVSISQASNWAAGKMEEVLSWPYANIVDGGPLTSPDGAYTLSWDVTNNTPIPNTKTVVITVTWNVRGKILRQVSSQFTEIISESI